jgi:D-glycero-alpha-D-manno-heptose-7-phosphate kinase
MIIHADAGTRIDLAGGTLDIFPIYLFEDFGITVNVSVDLNSQVRVATRKDRKIILIAEDLNLIEEAKSLDTLEPSGVMDLVARILKFYAPRQGVEVATLSNVPKGSGLGASSSLLISLSSALIRLTGKKVDPETVIDYGANIEAQSIRIPTGKQDYYPPMYGGFNAVWFGIEGARREKLNLSKKFRAALQQQLVLSFTGESRFSGTSNWNMMKKYIDHSGNTVEKMKEIKQTAVQMTEVLLRERLEDFGKLLDREWENRKQLAEGVTNARIDSVMAAARKAGAISSKICGAGGGGCMISFIKPGRHAAVSRALEEAGATVLDYRFRESGVRVKVERG